MRPWTNLVKTLRLKLQRNTVHSLTNRNNQATMDDKLRQLRAALIAVPSVPHQQLGQMVELLDREIGRQTSLPTFLAHNTHAHVRGLDHGNIVSAVADAAHALLGVLLDQLGDLGFLGGRAAAGHDGRQEHRH